MKYNRESQVAVLGFFFIPTQYFSCTDKGQYLSLTSAHLTRNERDFLPTYAPPTLPKGQIKIGRDRK